DGSRLEILLGDIRDAFAGKAEMPSADLIKALVELEGRPWAELGKNHKPLTQNRLARMLKPLRIAPAQIRFNDDNSRQGYRFDHFKEAFERYLPEIEGSQPKHRNKCDEIRTFNNSQPKQADSDVSVAKCEKSNNDGLCFGVTVAKGESGQSKRVEGGNGVLHH